MAGATAMTLLRSNPTPTLGRCANCQTLVAAVAGPEQGRARRSPPSGYRLGYVIETDRINTMVCKSCLQQVVERAS